MHFSGPQNADFTCTEANVQRTCATFGKTCVGMVKYPNATVDEYGNWDNINILPMTDPWGWCIYIYRYYLLIHHKNQPNVGKYTIHGSYGLRLVAGDWEENVLIHDGQGSSQC